MSISMQIAFEDSIEVRGHETEDMFSTYFLRRLRSNKARLSGNDRERAFPRRMRKSAASIRASKYDKEPCYRPWRGRQANG